MKKEVWISDIRIAIDQSWKLKPVSLSTFKNSISSLWKSLREMFPIGEDPIEYDEHSKR